MNIPFNDRLMVFVNLLTKVYNMIVCSYKNRYISIDIDISIVLFKRLFIYYCMYVSILIIVNKIPIGAARGGVLYVQGANVRGKLTIPITMTNGK